MRAHSVPGTSAPDPLSEWTGRLRAELLAEMAPGSIGAIAVAALGVASPGATAGLLAVIEGGTIMTSTAIGATVASHVGLKLAAGGLATVLTLGGAAAVTGNLPNGAQRFAADAAAHIGLNLPRPDAALDGSFDLSAGDIVNVGGAGRVGVTLGGDGLQLTGIESNAGFSAQVVTATPEVIIVEFRSAAETTSVLLSGLEGEVVSSITSTLHGSADAQTDAHTQGDGEAEADADAQLEVTVGG